MTRLPLELSLGPTELAAALRSRQGTSCFFDGAGDGTGWSCGPLVALDPRIDLTYPSRTLRSPDDALRALDRLLLARRSGHGSPSTGIALLLGYELFGSAARTHEALPSLLALRVDASVRFENSGPCLSVVDGGKDKPDHWRRRLDSLQPETGKTPAQAVGPPMTSLPRESYLNAIRKVQAHIEAGDIYQGNLCQRLRVNYRGDVFELYRRTALRSPAPRSAFIETSRFSVASLSPETFLTVDTAGRISTRPIKGTRPRGATPEEDRAAADELMASEKDHAELLMIVDLERNDLGRVCRTGSVITEELARLHSFPAVHHLVARVEGDLRAGVSVGELLRATYPGGSITGAPKLRAMQILSDLEPAPRRYFTGSLFWLGDDGSMDSSILIRSWIFSRGRADLGAGGGIVSDSEPELEWQESNHKARALTRILGFDPEEAR